VQRQGRIGNYPSYWTRKRPRGPALACAAQDWLFPTYHQESITLLRGLESRSILLCRSGRVGRFGFFDPRRYRVGPTSIAIAGPRSASRRRPRSGATRQLRWFGRSHLGRLLPRGDERRRRLPGARGLLLCKYRWAISTFSKQTASATIADKAVGYGMPAIRLDGFDAAACWKATRDATARSREGGREGGRGSHPDRGRVLRDRPPRERRRSLAIS
jgi:2-oxoisovalerate dehydrogenase E1 component alpha subunit